MSLLPSTQEAETGGSLEFQDSQGYSETQSQTKSNIGFVIVSVFEEEVINRKNIALAVLELTRQTGLVS